VAQNRTAVQACAILYHELAALANVQDDGIGPTFIVGSDEVALAVRLGAVVNSSVRSRQNRITLGQSERPVSGLGKTAQLMLDVNALVVSV